MIWARMLCWIDRHRPNRDRIKWDGSAYVGHCLHCGAAVRRLRKKRWTANFRGHPHAAPVLVAPTGTGRVAPRVDAEAPAHSPAEVG